MARINIARKLDVRAMSANFEALKKTLVEGDTTVHPLGTVLGKVSALAIANNPQDETKPAIMLMGSFEGIPADPSVSPVTADRGFLQPSHIHDMIVKQALGGKKLPVSEMPKRGRPIMVPIDGVIEFSCEVGIQYSKSAVGYTYIGEIDLPDGATDEFAEMKARLGIKPRGPALAAPKRAAALPAPSKKKRR